jgi:hypothetical protein
MRYCVRVRNQYAHRNFYDAYSGKLAFTNLEEIKKIQEPIKDLTWTTIKHVTPPLLEQQERYFLYVRDTIRYLNYEGRMRAKKLKSNPFDPPEKVTEPPLALDVDD